MKRLILTALLFSFLFWHANASKDWETRTATVTTSVTANDVINIQAKNTDLVIETWNKNEVEVTATIRYDGKMTDKMTKFLEEFEKLVKENIKQGGGELRIDSNLDEPNKVQIGSKKVGIIVGYSENELKLDYQIKAPANNKYIINNSYKDLRMIGNFKEVELSQYSGDLIAETVEIANFNLKYGTARFDRIEKAKMELYEQELDVKTLGTLDVNAKYSEFEFGQVEKLEASSYESEYIIDIITTLEGNFKYGEIEITDKLKTAKLECYEVEIEAGSIESIQFVNSKYSSLDAQQVNSLTFDQSYEDETDIGVLGTFVSKDSKYGNHTIGSLKNRVDLKAYEDEIEVDNVEKGATEISLDGKYIDAILGIENISFNLRGDVKYGKLEYNESAVNVRRYIKDGDQLEVEVESKSSSGEPIQISVKGYEIKINID